MPQTTEVFVKDTKTRILLVGAGLVSVGSVVLTQYMAAHPRPTGPMSPEMVLLCTLSLAYGAAFALTVGLWGGFPEWSHAFIPGIWRELFMQRYKARQAAQANPVSPFKWGSRLQVRLGQWAMVPLAGWLATQSSLLVTVFGRATGIIGACVGGILAIVLSQFLKR